MASSNSVAFDQQWSLTCREREVVLLVGTGMSNQDIARQLGLVEGTVKAHLHAIFRKTGVRRRYELIVQTAVRSSAA